MGGSAQRQTDSGSPRLPGARATRRTVLVVDVEGYSGRYTPARLLPPPRRLGWLPTEPNPSHSALADVRVRLSDLSPFRRAGSENPVWEFVLRLMTLWRRIDPGGFAHAMAQLRAGRLLAASGHFTRGPDVFRMPLSPGRLRRALT